MAFGRKRHVTVGLVYLEIEVGHGRGFFFGNEIKVMHDWYAWEYIHIRQTHKDFHLLSYKVKFNFGNNGNSNHKFEYVREETSTERDPNGISRTIFSGTLPANPQPPKNKTSKTQTQYMFHSSNHSLKPAFCIRNDAYYNIFSIKVRFWFRYIDLGTKYM